MFPHRNRQVDWGYCRWVIVGSAIIKEIEKYLNEPSEKLVNKVGEFVGQLIEGAKG